jgi:hypothetical protein
MHIHSRNYFTTGCSRVAALDSLIFYHVSYGSLRIFIAYISIRYSTRDSKVTNDACAFHDLCLKLHASQFTNQCLRRSARISFSMTTFLLATGSCFRLAVLVMHTFKTHDILRLNCHASRSTTLATHSIFTTPSLRIHDFPTCIFLTLPTTVRSVYHEQQSRNRHAFTTVSLHLINIRRGR